VKPEPPPCNCFPAGRRRPAEPGPFYTHLGSAASLPELRQELENRLNFDGNAIRIEKVKVFQKSYNKYRRNIFTRDGDHVIVYSGCILCRLLRVFDYRDN